MSEDVSGGCRCGNIRYHFDHAPRYMVNCHCRDCQHATGSAFFPGLMFLEREFTLEKGEPTWFESKSDKGNIMLRGFCPDCGSPVFLRNMVNEGIRLIYASSLDDPSIFKPVRDIFTASAHDWDVMDPALPKFAGDPDD